MVGRDDEERAATALRVALSAAVPLRIAALRRLDAVTFGRLYDRGRLDRLALTVAEHGDDVFFRSRKAGESAAAFNAVADAVALLAFAPGGVTLFGETWRAER